jgi:hypothetical protein
MCQFIDVIWGMRMVWRRGQGRAEGVHAEAEAAEDEVGPVTAGGMLVSSCIDGMVGGRVVGKRAHARGGEDLRITDCY